MKILTVSNFFASLKVGQRKPVCVAVKCDEAQLKQESAIYKYPDLNKYRKAVNEASFALVKDDVTLLQNKGKLFKVAKERVHEMGYQCAKNTSRSKSFGESSTEKEKETRKRSYISSSIREDRINELKETIKSTGETIKLLFKQKEQYFNINKYQQAADVNTTILHKTTEKYKLERTLKSLQEAGEKAKKYKKKKMSKNKGESSSASKPRQTKLSTSSSSMSSSSIQDGNSSGADTIILSDGEKTLEKTGVHKVVVDDSSPVLFPTDIDPDDEISPPASQVPWESGVEEGNFWDSPK